MTPPIPETFSLEEASPARKNAKSVELFAKLSTLLVERRVSVKQWNKCSGILMIERAISLLLLRESREWRTRLSPIL